MDLLATSKYTNFGLTYMNEYGEGIFGIVDPFGPNGHGSFIRYTNKLILDNGMVLYDSSEYGSNITEFLKIYNIKTSNNIEKLARRFHKFNVTYTALKKEFTYIDKYIDLKLDGEKIEKGTAKMYLTNGKKYKNIQIELNNNNRLNDVDPNAIAFITSFAEDYLSIQNRTYVHLLRIDGPMFEHCNVNTLNLIDISLDKAACASINVDTLRFMSPSVANPYLSYCKCKHLEIFNSTEVKFPPFPLELESLNINVSDIGTCNVSYLPYLKSLKVVRANTLILYELLDLSILDIDVKKLYIQEDIAKGISTLAIGITNGYGKVVVDLLKAMPNVENYKTNVYTEEMANVSQQLRSLDTVNIMAPLDKLPEHLERLTNQPLIESRNLEILKIRPSIRQITYDKAFDSIDIDEEFPDVEFLPYHTNLNENVLTHNKRARNRTMTLGSLAE